MPLQGKAALITGGGRGIGRAIAIAYAKAGADVCVAARSQDEIEAVATEITELGRKGIAETCDVSDRIAVESMVESAASQVGHLDI
ncbi:MAG: SDR family NAD(P)-dependent oxidoreductase, partial [Planctomycetes bacterium]|nr:SDR family NAD(P)-dependent oxidoreductase [Planctomycetota bacterium]